jgi:hypothetical protein
MAKTKQTPLVTSTIEFITSAGGNFTVQDIADRANVSYATAYQAVKIAVDQKIATYISGGRPKIYRNQHPADIPFHEIEDKSVKPEVLDPSEVMPSCIPVQEQFAMIEHITGMVIDGTAPAFLLTGMAGIGKTWTVRKQLEEFGLTKDVDYKWISGRASPMGLYETLHNNPAGLNIFDDCDDVLRESGSINILKSALDLYKTRIISWPSRTIKGSDLESSFEFTGQVIFISNLDFSRVADALTSRAFKVDVYLTPEQVIEKIQLIIEDIKPNGFEMKMKYKEDALEAVINLKDEILAMGKNLDIRAFEKACLLRKSAGVSDWENIKSMIKYQI